MVCSYRRIKYFNEKNGYTVAIYHASESETLNGKPAGNFTATGFFLPVNLPETVDIDFDGQWNLSKEYGLQFEVANFKQTVKATRKGIITYLETINGIGGKLAGEIYKAFGDNSLDVLDNTPENL